MKGKPSVTAAGLPHSDGSERAVLGAILLDAKALEAAWNDLEPEYFYDERHRQLYGALQKMGAAGKAIDLATVKAELGDRLEKIGAPYLATLTNEFPRASNVGAYAQKVKETLLLRRLLESARNAETAILQKNGTLNLAVAGLRASLTAWESREQPAARTFEQQAEDRYVLVVPAVGITFEIDRLRRESNELIGELCVKCRRPGARNWALSIADFNLSSARARSERAKHLAARSRLDEIDWPGYLEEFCQRVLAAERDGKPAVDLREMERPSREDDIRIDGLRLPRRHPAIVFGDGGAAKSYLALYLAGSLSQLGLTVALFDWELAGEDHRDRLERLFGLAMPRISYVRCERPLIYEADRHRRIVRDEGTDYAFYDSVAFACDGPPESAEVAGRYPRAVRQIGAGSLHIAHVSKTEGADAKPFGSVFWHNGARSTWYAKLADESADGRTLHLGLFQKKANLGRLQRPAGFKVVFDSDRTWFERSDPADTPELAEKMPVWQRMARLLQPGAIGVDELAEAMGVEKNTVWKTIQRKPKVFRLLDGGKVFLAQ